MEPPLRLLVRVVGWDLEASASSYPVVDCPSSRSLSPKMPHSLGQETKFGTPCSVQALSHVSSMIG